MKVPQPPGPHFSAGDLLPIRSESQYLGSEAEVRLVHHLALLCPGCWAAVEELPAVAGADGVHGVPAALQTLALAPAERVKLRANHRAAIAAARREPLGFCRVVLEELWSVAVLSGFGPGLPDMVKTAFAPILANGACLVAPREAHDLQGHFFTLLAHSCYRAKEPNQTVATLALAQAHLTRGKGEPEPRASLLEVEAELVFDQDDRGRARGLLEEARQLVVGHEPADRQAEILARQATATLDDDETKATAIYRQALAILDQLDPCTNAALRNRLNEMAFLKTRVLRERTSG